MRLVLIALALLAVAVACGDDDEGGREETPNPSPTLTPLENVIGWEEAVELIRGCEVASVMQAHSRDVYIMLDDGTELHTVEPEIDLVLQEASEAMEDCGPIGMATE